MNWLTRLLHLDSPQKAKPRAKPSSSPTTKACARPSEPLIACRQNLSPEQLKKFAPLRDLDEHSIATIPHGTLLYHKDATVFIHGQPSDGVYYLLEGSLSMQPNSDNSYQVHAGGALASLPLNSGKHFGATATTLTDASILKISMELNHLWSKQCHEELSCVELIDIQLPDALGDSRFFNSFAKAYHENKLRLPSLPNVAFKLKQAMQQDIGIDQAVEIIHIDPPIVAKLIQVANSPLYATGTPINNCHDAVNRIGLNATRNLVLGISLKQLFQCTDRELMKGMQALWKNSLYVSSLSFVLAQQCSRLNPEDALLAGLVCDIGAIPLLHFAEQFPDLYPGLAELQASLPYLRGPVGALVLHTLGFSSELTNIPHQAENWLFDSGEELTLADIVILAKLHSYFGSNKAKDLPFINSIPAYSKLEHGKLDPDFSLTILRQAQNRISAAMHLLS